MQSHHLNVGPCCENCILAEFGPDLTKCTVGVPIRRAEVWYAVGYQICSNLLGTLT
jgi:hypothetical protein